MNGGISQSTEHAGRIYIYEDFSVVGIVVAPSKLEALKEFLHHMNSDSGLAFIIAQQGTTTGFSPSVDISPETSMKCVYAQDDMDIYANHIYVIPPQKDMTIRAGKLFVSDAFNNPDNTMPADRLMFELADSFGDKAICVMLSREGLDGSRGIDAINLVNGLVIAEASHQTVYTHLSKDALQTEHVDYASSPREIPARILEYISFFGNHKETSIVEECSTLFSILQQATGVDFTLYKQTSILRRLQRQMQAKKIKSLHDYNRLLNENEDEVSELQRNLLIGVTHFFRDPDAFAFIAEKIIPTMIAQRTQEKQIRIWVAGCSTGEEVYSLAILIRQYLRNMREDVEVKIFATDLDKVSIEYASRGIYPKTISRSLTEEHLTTYFTPVGHEYQISKEIRDMVIFAQHNLLRDPPFSQLDLIVCRNLLIYLKPETQIQVISVFLFALKSNAFLFVGPSETLGELEHAFQVINGKWNVYQSKDMNQGVSASSFSASNHINIKKFNQSEKVAVRIKEADHILKMDSVYNKLIEEYVHPFILIDENNEITHINGVARDYLTIASGKPSHNLFKMMPEYLSIVIRAALHKVRKEQREVEYRDILIKDGGQQHAIHLVAKPIQVANNTLTVVFFERVKETENRTIDLPAETPTDTGYVIISDHAGQHIKELEHELLQAKASLQSATEELDTSNEEFQAVNEELIVANEELQSTIEELQSVNEELMAVNSESQRQIRELTVLNNDMDNFFISTNIATLFLDTKMNVRKFTPAITHEINVIATDVGRPLGDISHKLKYRNFLTDVKSVLHTGTGVEKEVLSHSGKWFTLRVLPYCTDDNPIQGVVITLTDVTGLKQITDELLILSYAISQSPGCILITDAERRIKYINLKYREQTNYSLDELLDTRLELYSDKLSNEQLREIWVDVAARKNWVGELVNTKKNGESYYEVASLKPIVNHTGEVTHYLKISEDLTEKYHTLELLQKSELMSAVGQLAAGIAHEIRNPLTVLKGFLDLIAPDMEKKHYIDIMASEFARIETIVNELLLLARPQEVHFEKENVMTILQDVIMLIETQATLNNVEIITKYTSPIPWVICVQNQLKQVFINILKNGIEAMPQGGNLIVKVNWIEPDAISISIIDQGEGIADDKIPKLGTPFYTTKEDGTGLGLLVSSKIIENHQGRIEFQSQLGKGTVVDIILKATKTL